MADEVMNKKPIIKYLLNGEYKEATVADVGDLSQLKTTVKTTLVDAINALFNGEGSSGSIPEDVQNDINDLQDAVDGLNNGLSGLGDAFENQKVENDQKLQDLLDEINKNINDTKTVIEQTITDVTNEYQTKVDQVTNELNDAKGNIATTIDDLSKVKDELTNIDLNIKNISVVIDEINLQLTSKVEKSDFDLLEAEVKKNTTQITQNAEEIALKASQESLNVATGRIAQNEAQIKVNADKIESKVSQEEVREEIEKIDRFGKNLFHRTREWHNSEWNLNGFTVSSDTYMRCHIVTISENNKPVTQIVDNLVVGDTYNISVYAKADNTTAKVYGKISGVTEPIKMVRVGSSDDTLVGTDFYRLNGSFVATDTTLDIGFIFQSLATGKKGYLSAGKLEHSALPSDWQPNADDTYEAVIRNESAINQVADEIELVVETTEQQGKDIENNKSSIDVLNDSITLQTEKITEIDGVVKEQGAQLEIAQDQISQKVSQTDIDQSIADIDIDTKNRILNSDFQREFENWNEVNSGFKIVEKDGVKYAHIERTGLTAVQIASMSSDKFLVKPSDRLMFSFDFIVDDLSKLDNKTLFTVELFDIKDVRVDFKNYTISDLHNDSVSNGEVARLYSSWEINREDVSKGRIKYNLYQNGSVYFTKAMLQSGQMNSTEWDSAPEDAYIIRGKLESSIEQNAKEIALKVSQVDFDVMGDSVKENTANIQIANDSITNTVKELEKTNEKVSANETEIAQTKEQISLKADSLEVDNLEGRMSEAEAQIVLNTEGITQTVKDIETVANTAESIRNIADQAKANADKANSSINEMGQDNKLSPVEKKAISTEWETIKSEYATIKGQADKYSVTSTTYTTAYNSLTSYITTLKLGETTSTTIAPDVFRTQFKTYYSEKVKILNAISDKVKELGDTAAQNVKSWAESEIKQTADSITSTVKSYTDEQVSGVSTIYTHPAWANSPDGTVDFTTVYPGENAFSDSEKEITNGDIPNPEFLSPYWLDLTPLIDKHGIDKEYTISFDLASKDTTNSNSIRFYSYPGSPLPGKYLFPMQTYTVTTEYQRFSLTFKPILNDPNSTQSRIGFYGNYGSGNVPIIRKVKFEVGDTPTIYTPSPQDDPIGAYPKYMGTCSNHSETAPTDPSKYIWQPNPEIPLSKAYMTGENGEGFSTEKIGENFLVNTEFKTDLKNWDYNGRNWLIDKNTLFNGRNSVKQTFSTGSGSDSSLSQTLTKNLSENDDVVWSIWAKSDSPTGKLHLEIFGSVYKADLDVGTSWTRLFIKGKLKSTFKVYVWNMTAGTYWISEPKFEKGINITPYIPSPIDDPINCIPKYLGTSPKPIDKWTDYTWSLNPDYLSNLTEIAQDTADNANNTLSEMSKDTILSPLEKTSLLKEWTTIQSDYPLVKAQGDKYKVATTTLKSTYDVLNGYVPPLLNNKMNENSTIVPDRFNTNFKNYYDAKLNVLNGVNNVIQGNITTEINNVKTWTSSEIKQATDSIELSVNKTIETEIKNVNDKVDNIEVGGRNLILNSNVLYENSNYMVAEYTTSVNLVSGKTYTVSLKGTKKESQQFGLWLDGAITSIGSLSHKGNDIYTLSFKAPTITSGNEKRVRIYQPADASRGPAKIEWIKLESGNKATDWTPAPEDAQSAIDKAQSDANKANSVLSDYAKDTILSPLEKTSVATEWEGIQVEFTTISTQANSYGINVGYSSAFNSLKSYIEPLLNNMTTNSTIKPDEFKGKFKTYYDTKTKCLTEINKKIQGGVDSLGNYTAYANDLNGKDFTKTKSGENLFINSDFSRTKIIAQQAKNPNLYPTDMDSYNYGIANPTTSYHAYIDDKKFPGNNVVAYNESDGSRNWKGLSITFTEDAKQKLRTNEKKFFSVDIFTTIIGAKIFGGFHYVDKNSGKSDFHDGSYYITPTKANSWDRFIAETPLSINRVDWSKPVRFYIYGYNFPVNAILYIDNISLQNGSNSVSYLPSPQDDPVKAHMQYIGYSIKDSNDYKDYTWQVNPEVPLKKAWKTGESGEGFSLVEIGDNLVSYSMLHFINQNGITGSFDDKTGIIQVKGTTTAVGDLWGFRGASEEYGNDTNIYSYSVEVLSGSFPKNVGLQAAIYKKGERVWVRNVRSKEIDNLTIVVNSGETIRDLGMYSYAAGAQIDMSLKVKLEIGNIPTPYVPSPQDDPVNCYPKYLGTSPNGGEKWTDYTWALNPEYVAAVANHDTTNVYQELSARIEVTENGIKNQVESTETITKGLDGLNQAISGEDGKGGINGEITSVKSRVSKVEQTANSWSTTLKNHEKQIGEQGTVITDVTDYMEFTTSGLKIGKSTSPFSVNLSNEKLDFMENNIPIAWINGTVMHITRAEINNEIVIGPTVIKEAPNGQLGFFWRG